MRKRKKLRNSTNSQNLLIFNYSMNESSQIFSHQPKVAKALTKEFAHVSVITNERPKNEYDLPANLSVHYVDWVPKQRFRNVFKLVSTVLKVERRFRPSIVFFHMTETQAAFIGPIYKMLGKYQVLWYAHISKPIRLKIAAAVMNQTLASTKGSSPLTDCIFIGQAIDVDVFSFRELEAFPDSLRVVHIGRLDPSKKIYELILWFLANRNDLNLGDLTIVGQPTFGNASYLKKIEEHFQKEIGEGLIKFRGKVDHVEIPGVLMDFDVFLHLFEGSLDKSVMESTACGIVTISNNSEFKEQFGTWRELIGNKEDSHFVSENVESFLVSEFRAIQELEISELKLELMRRRQVVQDRHSFVNWIDSVTRVLKEGTK